MLRIVISLVCVSCFLCRAADRILFGSLAPGQANLFISNADGAQERALAHSGALDYNPSWSPDGAWIVFTSERAGSADLFRIHPDGSGLERLTDDPSYDDQAAFSPDSKQIVFVTTRAAGTADLWILDLATRKARALTSGPGGDFRPSWSPDGKWIAFSSDRASDLPMAKGRWEHLQLADVYVVHPDGTGLKRISEHGNFCGSPKWSRDSQSVVSYCMSAQETWTYRDSIKTGETKLVRIDISTGVSTPIATGPGVKMSPVLLAGNQIAYVRKDTSAPGVFYGTGKPGPAGADVRSPSWSPDGTRVVYSRVGPIGRSLFEKRWSRNPKYELISTGVLPAYDSTGDRFLVTKLGDDNGSKLMLTENGKPARPILERKHELILGPQWSPAGDAIMFGIGQFSAFLDFAIGNEKPVDPVNGGAQVASVKPDGSGFHQITSGPNNNGFPGYSPDGKRIVYRTMGPQGDGLRIMNLENHSISVLTNDYDNFPVWSPRGDLIAFVRRVAGDFEVFSIRPDGTNLRRLTNSKGNEAHLAFSPDGEKILFSSTRTGFKDEALYTIAPQPYGELFVMRYDGTQVEQLTDNQWEDAGPSWQPRRSRQGTK
jgi:TolB protein